MTDKYNYFKNYFADKNPWLAELASSMDYESFVCLYDSLEVYEQDAFIPDAQLDEYQSLSRLMIMTKLLMRGVDGAREATTCDDEGMIHITLDSNIAELPLEFQTYCDLITLGVATLGQALAELNKDRLEEQIKEDLRESFKDVFDNPNVDTSAIEEV
jgi:hypothetical protein